MMAALEDISPFKIRLVAECGLQFGAERERTLREALLRRIKQRGLSTADDYLRLLKADCREMQELVELLTVNETYFMREPEYLRLLVDRLIPEMLVRRGSGGLRIFCAGCSTGEEAYSLAILLDQRFGAAADNFSLVAADIDSQAIAAARRGLYYGESFRGADELWRRHYFEPQPEGGWQLKEDIRRRVKFEARNLISPSPLPSGGEADFILYRNVSIYFPPPVQREIFSHLAAQLVPGGSLLVGASETLHHDLGILELEKRDSLYFFRKHDPGIAKRRSRFLGERRSTTAPGSPPQPAGCRTERVKVSDYQIKGGREPGEPFDQALILARRQRFDEARELLERITKENPTDSRAHALDGCILVELEEFEGALQRGLEALEHDPLCLEAYLLLGIGARQRADHREAARRFREALYIERFCWPAHFYLAESALFLEDSERACRGYRNALEILGRGEEAACGRSFFPLNCNPAHFAGICRHKLATLTCGENVAVHQGQ
mgnify:CR=1 FL=1